MSALYTFPLFPLFPAQPYEVCFCDSDTQISGQGPASLKQTMAVCELVRFVDLSAGAGGVCGDL